MSAEGTIAAVVMVIIGLLWLALPLLGRNSSFSAQELARQKNRAVLLTAYERTLASIRDLDDDHLTGKLAQSDYITERNQLTEQGVAILQELEKHSQKKLGKQEKGADQQEPAPTNVADPDAQLDEAIEQAVAAYIKSTH